MYAYKTDVKCLECGDHGESVVRFAEVRVGVTTSKDWKINFNDIEAFYMTVEAENLFLTRKDGKEHLCQVQM